MIAVREGRAIPMEELEVETEAEAVTSVWSQSKRSAIFISLSISYAAVTHSISK